MDVCAIAAALAGVVADAAIPRAAGLGADPVLRADGRGDGTNAAARRRRSAAAQDADARGSADLGVDRRGTGATAMGWRCYHARSLRARPDPGCRYLRLDGAARLPH